MFRQCLYYSGGAGAGQTLAVPPASSRPLLLPAPQQDDLPAPRPPGTDGGPQGQRSGVPHAGGPPEWTHSQWTHKQWVRQWPHSEPGAACVAGSCDKMSLFVDSL